MRSFVYLSYSRYNVSTMVDTSISFDKIEKVFSQLPLLEKQDLVNGGKTEPRGNILADGSSLMVTKSQMIRVIDRGTLVITPDALTVSVWADDVIPLVVFTTTEHGLDNIYLTMGEIQIHNIRMRNKEFHFYLNAAPDVEFFQNLANPLARWVEGVFNMNCYITPPVSVSSPARLVLNVP